MLKIAPQGRAYWPFRASTAVAFAPAVDGFARRLGNDVVNASVVFGARYPNVVAVVYGSTGAAVMPLIRTDHVYETLHVIRSASSSCSVSVNSLCPTDWDPFAVVCTALPMSSSSPCNWTQLCRGRSPRRRGQSGQLAPSCRARLLWLGSSNEPRRSGPRRGADTFVGTARNGQIPGPQGDRVRGMS